MNRDHSKLLKRVRISLFALTAMLGVSTAMAMKMEHKRAIQSYRFISEEPNRYVVQQAALAADSYDCNTNPSSICTIESSTAPVLMGGQYKLEKTSSSLTPGVFE